MTSSRPSIPRRVFPATALIAALSLLLFAAAVRWGWFGPDTGVGSNFCEAAHEGALRQPANTLSNLGFVAAGLLAAHHFDGHRGRLTKPRLLAPFPALIVLLGPGSMAMHATQSEIGGRLDVASMFLVAGFAASYGITRLLGRGIPTLTTLFVVLVGGAEAAGAVRRSAPLVDTVGNLAFAILLITALVVEVALRRRPERPRSLAAAGGAIGSMVVAFTIWSFSRDDGALCDPHSVLQGHAVWHLLCALSAYCLYRYYASQTREA